MKALTDQQIADAKTEDNRKRHLGLISGLVIILGLMAIFGWKLFDSAQSQVEIGPAPDFSLSLFDGGQVTLSHLRGQVVVVNFWASWCVPCRDEAPILEQAWSATETRG